MKHIILAALSGWNSEKKVLSFDADTYTSAAVQAQLKPHQGRTIDGYPYTGYEYGCQKYHDFTYIGEIEDDKAPTKKREVEYCLLKDLFR